MRFKPELNKVRAIVCLFIFCQDSKQKCINLCEYRCIVGSPNAAWPPYIRWEVLLYSVIFVAAFITQLQWHGWLRRVEIIMCQDDVAKLSGWVKAAEWFTAPAICEKQRSERFYSPLFIERVKGNQPSNSPLYIFPDSTVKQKQAQGDILNKRHLITF